MKKILMLIILLSTVYSSNIKSWFSNFNISADYTNKIEVISNKTVTNLYFILDSLNYVDNAAIVYDVSYKLTLFEVFLNSFKPKYTGIIYKFNLVGEVFIDKVSIKEYFKLPVSQRADIIRERVYLSSKTQQKQQQYQKKATATP